MRVDVLVLPSEEEVAERLSGVQVTLRLVSLIMVVVVVVGGGGGGEEGGGGGGG